MSPYPPTQTFFWVVTLRDEPKERLRMNPGIGRARIAFVRMRGHCILTAYVTQGC